MIRRWDGKFEVEVMKRRWQISLRLILILTTLCCGYFACDVKYRKLRNRVNILEELGAKVEYHSNLLGFVPRIGYLADVKTIQLSHTAVNSEQIALLPAFKRLERLYLARTQLTDGDLKVIGGLSRLRRLALWGTRLSDERLEFLRDLQQLRLLDIHSNRRLTEACFSTLNRLSRLERAIIDPIRLSDSGCQELAKMPRADVGQIRLNQVSSRGLEALAKIQPGKFSVIGFNDCLLNEKLLLKIVGRDKLLPVGPDLEVMDSLISKRVLAHFPWETLRGVRFRGADVTFDDVIEFLGPRKPNGLLAGEVIGISEDWDPKNWVHRGMIVWLDTPSSSLTAEQLARLPDLEQVQFQNEQSLGEFLIHLRDHEKLKRLHVASAPEGSPLIDQIAQLSNLERLTLNVPRARTSLSSLGRLKKLEELNLYGVPIDDEGMGAFRQMPSLQKLALHQADGVHGPGLKNLLDLESLRQVTIRSRRDWNRSIDLLLTLKRRVATMTIIDTKLSEENLNRFRSMGGARRLSWPR